MIDEFKDRIDSGFQRFFIGQDRQAVAVVPDNQIVRETAVYIPTSVCEALFYLFPIHGVTLSHNSGL